VHCALWETRDTASERCPPYGIAPATRHNEMNTPRLNPSQVDYKASIWFIYLKVIEGWVKLGGWLYTRWFTCPQTAV